MKESESLKKGIRKLVSELQENKMKELESRISKKIDSSVKRELSKSMTSEKHSGFFKKEHTPTEELKKDISSIQHEMTTIINELKKNRDRIEKAEKSSREADALKDRVKNIDVDGMESEIQKQIEEIDKKISEEHELNKKIMERTGIDINYLKECLSEKEKLEKNFDVERLRNILRDIEILKTKTQWLEEELERFNPKPLQIRISELENTIRTMKASSPMILE